MKYRFIFCLVFLFVFSNCKKSGNNAVTIHCEGLETDTAGTGDDGRVFLPNAFTPNSDGINDIFRPLMLNIASFQFTVYDENSSVVFTSSTAGQGWNTALTPNEAVKYYYRVQATTQSGRKIGTCGEVYKIACLPSWLPASQLYFEDQWTPLGFNGVSSEVLANCP